MYGKIPYKVSPTFVLCLYVFEPHFSREAHYVLALLMLMMSLLLKREKSIHKAGQLKKKV